jgi:hypothetical protein
MSANGRSIGAMLCRPDGITVYSLVLRSQSTSPASFLDTPVEMLHNSLTTILIFFTTTQAVSIVPSPPTVSQTVTPTVTDTGTRRLSTESIISIVSVVVTVVIGIATLIVTILGIALAWWQWRKSRGRARRASFPTNGMQQSYIMNLNVKLTHFFASRLQVS